MNYREFLEPDDNAAECVACENTALHEVNDILKTHGKSIMTKYGFPPLPPKTNAQMRTNTQLYIPEAEKAVADAMIQTLNEHQRAAFNTILEAMEDENLDSRCFFLDGPGGSGKTYLYTTLLSYVRGLGDIALPVASTGIAANLLKGGRTYHSQFKVFGPFNETTTSDLRETSVDADLIRKAKVIIWDESTMADTHALDAVNRLLKTLMRNNKPFGGKVLLLGGDFRQTLPILKHGSRGAIVEACIKFNRVWNRFKRLKLTNNVRSEDPEFSDWLIKLGDGTLPIPEGCTEDVIEIPEDMLSSGQIVEEIFGTALTIEDIPHFSKIAILCPKNSDVDQINEEVLSILEGDTTTYLSSDAIVDGNAEEINNYPMEFLNDLNPSGMPPHKLNLKKGALIMLLRNLNTKRGLCNGTRMIVHDLKPNLIIAKVLTGSAEGQLVFIPRVDLKPSDADLPFTLRRRQFPIKLAFAITINKAQGQTLEKVGIYLPDPVFGHGQLYVAISRVRRRCNVKIKIVEGLQQGRLITGSDKMYTKNVVYREVYDL
jgi:ATP-dependent DNA helicase PIF1